MGLATWAPQEADRRLSPLGSRWAHTQGVAALESLPKRLGILFPNANGRRVDINSFRNR